MKTKTFPTLYGLAKNGKTKEWTISVGEHTISSGDTGWFVYTASGYQDGIKAEHVRRVHGKSIGKSNETTPCEQATLEAQSDWNKKKDQGYVENTADLASVKIRPMLAHDYTKQGAKIKFPCFIQPKLNGVRCLVERHENGVSFWSRNGKSFPVLEQHKALVKELGDLMRVGDWLDGEIYVHGWRFQHIVSALTAFSKETTHLQYHVYDVVDRNKQFGARFESNLPRIERLELKHVVAVKTTVCGLAADVSRHQQRYVAEGYEGLMLRNKAGMYVPNYRSYDLQKYKTFIDEEFEIVGATYDVEGGVIWTCSSKYADPFDNLFNVRPMGTLTQRKKMWAECTKYFGKQLTVKYQELSVDGMPIFPVGVGVREYE